MEERIADTTLKKLILSGEKIDLVKFAKELFGSLPTGKAFLCR